MNPAYSVIFFTTASGAGYGLLIWLAIARAYPLSGVHDAVATIGLMLALVLISAGLLASTAHLGHPERAWRALSQWRSSWLSREGVAAVATYFPAGGLLLAPWFFPNPLISACLAMAAATLALVTVYCTAMIYASLKPIPRWHNAWVPPTYLAFALATGATLHNAVLTLAGAANAAIAYIAAACSVFAWIVKIGYWRWADRGAITATSGSATGLTKYGVVRLFESPHTSKNYVQREMGYRIARKHALRLRRLALSGGLIGVLSLLGVNQYDHTVAVAFAIAAVVITMLAVVIERWLFFAEAEHVVGLYYGDESV